MKTLAIALAAATLVGCSNETTAPVQDAEGVLLEIEYVNYAWTPTYLGFFIDAEGDIYSFDREGVQWPHQDKTVLTAAELESKYLKRTLVSTRDSAEVPTVAAKIAQVNPTQVSAQKQECADAGILTYRAYKRNAGSNTYVPILLRMEGDYAKQNTSAAAQELITYIRSLGVWTEMLGCDP